MRRDIFLSEPLFPASLVRLARRTFREFIGANRYAAAENPAARERFRPRPPSLLPGNEIERPMRSQEDALERRISTQGGYVGGIRLDTRVSPRERDIRRARRSVSSEAYICAFTTRKTRFPAAIPREINDRIAVDDISSGPQSNRREIGAFQEDSFSALHSIFSQTCSRIATIYVVDERRRAKRKTTCRRCKVAVGSESTRSHRIANHACCGTHPEAHGAVRFADRRKLLRARAHAGKGSCVRRRINDRFGLHAQLFRVVARTVASRAPRTKK